MAAANKSVGAASQVTEEVRALSAKLDAIKESLEAFEKASQMRHIELTKTIEIKFQANNLVNKKGATKKPAQPIKVPEGSAKFDKVTSYLTYAYKCDDKRARILKEYANDMEEAKVTEHAIALNDGKPFTDPQLQATKSCVYIWRTFLNGKAADNVKRMEKLKTEFNEYNAEIDKRNSVQEDESSSNT